MIRNDTSTSVIYFGGLGLGTASTVGVTGKAGSGQVDVAGRSSLSVPTVDGTNNITSITDLLIDGISDIWDGQSEFVGRGHDKSVGLSLGPGAVTGTSTGDRVRWDGTNLPTKGWVGSLLPDNCLTSCKWDSILEGEGHGLGVGGLKDSGWFGTTGCGDGSGCEQSFGSGSIFINKV